MADGRVIPGTYQHFKGGKYYVFGVSTDTESGERVVVYMPLYGEFAGKLLHRKLSNFLEEVDRPDFNYNGPRFFRIEE